MKRDELIARVRELEGQNTSLRNVALAALMELANAAKTIGVVGAMLPGATKTQRIAFQREKEVTAKVAEWRTALRVGNGGAREA